MGIKQASDPPKIKKINIYKSQKVLSKNLKTKSGGAESSDKMF